MCVVHKGYEPNSLDFASHDERQKVTSLDTLALHINVSVQKLFSVYVCVCVCVCVPFGGCLYCACACPPCCGET